MARAVIVVGIPYPNIKDPKIVMNALRDESGLAMLQQKIQSASSRFARTTPGLFSSTAAPTLQSLIGNQ
jgi:Rad3-related DNA helicase